MEKISKDWTPEERLSLIAILAKSLSSLNIEDRLKYLHTIRISLIESLATEPRENLEAGREAIETKVSDAEVLA